MPDAKKQTPLSKDDIKDLTQRIARARGHLDHLSIQLATTGVNGSRDEAMALLADATQALMMGGDKLTDQQLKTTIPNAVDAAVAALTAWQGALNANLTNNEAWQALKPFATAAHSVEAAVAHKTGYVNDAAKG